MKYRLKQDGHDQNSENPDQEQADQALHCYFNTVQIPVRVMTICMLQV